MPLNAILFSASPKMVNVEDALGHLRIHKELYWEVNFPIVISQFQFPIPIKGYIHICGRRVEWVATISRIEAYSVKHYQDKSKKPRVWIEREKSAEGQNHWKNALIMTDIRRFDFDTYDFEQIGGAPVTHPPQKYIRVKLPK